MSLLRNCYYSHTLSLVALNILVFFVLILARLDDGDLSNIGLSFLLDFLDLLASPLAGQVQFFIDVNSEGLSLVIEHLAHGNSLFAPLSVLARVVLGCGHPFLVSLLLLHGNLSE